MCEKIRRSVIFDLDGTLLDTLTDLKNSLNIALQQSGFPERTQDEVRRFVGNGLAKLVERAVPQGKENPLYETVLLETRTQYALHCEEFTAPYDGILPMLRVLHDAGYALGVVSNKPHKQVVSLCETYFSGYMDGAAGGQDGIPLKPAPDSICSMMSQLQSDAAHTVYVGDSDVDIDTARNAGVPCISVLWGFRDIDLLIKAGGTLFVDAPSEITHKVSEIFGD